MVAWRLPAAMLFSFYSVSSKNAQLACCTARAQRKRGCRCRLALILDDSDLCTPCTHSWDGHIRSLPTDLGTFTADILRRLMQLSLMTGNRLVVASNILRYAQDISCGVGSATLIVRLPTMRTVGGWWLGLSLTILKYRQHK